MYHRVKFQSIIRGHHVYKSIWSPYAEETLMAYPDDRPERNVEVTGKCKREVGLVVPAKFSALTKDKKTAKVLDKELFKRKTRYKCCLELIHQQKNVYRMFPIYVL